MRQKFNPINKFCITNTPLNFCNISNLNQLHKKVLEQIWKKNDKDFDDLDIAHLREI